MLRKFHFLLILISFLFPLLLGGCWDMRPMKERGIVVGIGVDKIEGEEQILVSLQVVDTSALKGGTGGMGAGEKSTPSKSAVVVETSRGKTLYDAIHNFLAYSSRQITFAHNRVVILGNDLAKSDISGVLDDMYRDYQFRMANWMFVAEKTAKEILESQTDLGAIPAIELSQMMVNETENAFTIPVHRSDFVYQLNSEGNSGFIPLAQIEQPGINPFPRIRIEKAAIFNGNRLVDILSEDESQGLVWLYRGQKGGTVVFPFKSSKDKEQKLVSIEVWDGKTKIIPHRSKNELVLEIICSGKGILRESENVQNNSTTFTTLGKSAAQVLKRRVVKTIKKAQQINVDFLGFARIIHQEEPELWRQLRQNWKQEFPLIRSEVSFKINIDQFGNSKSSILRNSERGD
ncbi:MAG TPA: Ger(x)C family spore germination protein [Bacillota bacterium]|nr:Ger(x)C family spore germination protein [Bacillota bacterium]